jgi:hypothetical protein
MKKYSFLLSPLMLAAANSLACSFPASTLDQQTEKADEIFIATLIEAKLLPKDSRHEWPWIEGLELRHIQGTKRNGHRSPERYTSY